MKDLLDIKITESIIFSFHVKVKSANLDTFLKEFIEMIFNLEAKSMRIFKGIGFYWNNEKYPQLCTAVEPILLTFQICISWNLGLAMLIIYLANREALWTKNMIICNSNPQPNILDLLNARQNPFFSLKIIQNLKVHLYLYFTDYFLMSSSSCRATSMDIPDPLSPPLPIVHHFWQILRATPHILTELLYVGASWSPWLCSAMWRGP